MVQQLPKFAALKSKYNHNYLRYLNDKSSPVHTFLQYSEKNILADPFTKLELEPAKSDPSLIHIKCCYNNKYWASWPSDHHFIVAGAEQKEEDKTKWTCTLFRPIYEIKHESFRFCHVNLGSNVVLWRVGPPYGECLRAQWSDPDRDLCDLSTVIDWDSLISLPKHVAFKSNHVGPYLCVRLIDDLPYLQFSSDSIDDPSIQTEIFTTNDGRMYLKSSDVGKIWRRGKSNWIFADYSETTTQTSDTLFTATKLDSSNVVALRNLGNDKFVKRYTLASRKNYLNAATKEIDEFSHLIITELVRSREIYDVIFHPSEARILDQSVHVVASGSTSNKTKVPNTVDLNISYTDTSSSSWTSSISTKLSDVKTTIKSGVPVIVGGKINILTTNNFVGEYKWGENITKSKTGKVTYKITIPPLSTIFIKVVATKGTCEIPFSYKQRDILICGKTVEFSLNDGVYNGTNYYNLSYELETKPI